MIKTENYCATCKNEIVAIWLSAGRPPLGDPKLASILSRNVIMIPLDELREIMNKLEEGGEPK